jgi:Flp pilus assembly protein TadD
MAEAEKAFREGDYYSAERKYGRAIRRQEDLPDPYIGAMLSSLHAYSSSYSLAGNYLAEALVLRPQLVDAPVDLAALHGTGEADKFDRALEAIDQTILRRGAQPEALLLRAYFRYRRGDTTGARGDLVQARTLRESRIEGDASQEQESEDVLLAGIEAFLEQIPEPQS